MDESTAKLNTTTSAQINAAAREVDFVTRFGENWESLRNIMGISRPIRKAPGTKLVAYTASVDGTLQGGATVKEGEEIPYTKMKVTPVDTQDIVIEKYAKAVTIEAVAKYGAAVAVQKTDSAFLAEIQNHILGKFYTTLNNGSLTGKGSTWQRALALAKGAVLAKFADMNKEVTEVVGFANIMDAYDWMGDANITVQSEFGLNYIKNFMGYSTLFLCADKHVAQGTVIACPVENIDLYYVDPSDSDFAQLGLEYRVQGETNLIGFHVNGNYATAVGECFALNGMALWPEYRDGIAVYTVGEETD